MTAGCASKNNLAANVGSRHIAESISQYGIATTPCRRSRLFGYAAGLRDTCPPAFLRRHSSRLGQPIETQSWHSSAFHL